ncbi:hypothetical protein, partial [Bifidobacterium longum]|uniref:hypothetical protein n=1 Tax=Bifidobacterium longum TaxID=216816 RepID=UPI001E43CF88
IPLRYFLKLQGNHVNFISVAEPTMSPPPPPIAKSLKKTNFPLAFCEDKVMVGGRGLAAVRRIGLEWCASGLYAGPQGSVVSMKKD